MEWGLERGCSGVVRNVRIVPPLLPRDNPIQRPLTSLPLMPVLRTLPTARLHLVPLLARLARVTNRRLVPRDILIVRLPLSTRLRARRPHAGPGPRARPWRPTRKEKGSWSSDGAGSGVSGGSWWPKSDTSCATPLPRAPPGPRPARRPITGRPGGEAGRCRAECRRRRSRSPEPGPAAAA